MKNIYISLTGKAEFILNNCYNFIRIDVGGKLLTNHLKEVISYRQLQVMDETYVMNQVRVFEFLLSAFINLPQVHEIFGCYSFSSPPLKSTQFFFMLVRIRISQ